MQFGSYGGKTRFEILARKFGFAVFAKNTVFDGKHSFMVWQKNVVLQFKQKRGFAVLIENTFLSEKLGFAVLAEKCGFGRKT